MVTNGILESGMFRGRFLMSNYQRLMSLSCCT